MPAQPSSPAADRLARSRFGFSGHQTFPFRYGWLKKAVDSARFDGAVFSQEDALVTLGVGKNMVQSIQHWALAAEVLEDVGRGFVAVSELGGRLLEHWDPYLEDPGSLWLVHWLIASNPSRTGTWNLAFTRFDRPEFGKAELVEFVGRFATAQGSRANENTLTRDIEVFVRTYVPGRTARGPLEDSFDCPLAELGLLLPLREADRYRFAVGPKPTLPVEVFGFALVEFAKPLLASRRTLSMHEVQYGTGSPGQVFKLDENSLASMMDELEDLTGGAIELDHTEGLKQVYFRSDSDPLDLLERHYAGEGAA